MLVRFARHGFVVEACEARDVGDQIQLCADTRGRNANTVASRSGVALSVSVLIAVAVRRSIVFIVVVVAVPVATLVWWLEGAACSLSADARRLAKSENLGQPAIPVAAFSGSVCGHGTAFFSVRSKRRRRDVLHGQSRRRLKSSSVGTAPHDGVVSAFAGHAFGNALVEWKNIHFSFVAEMEGDEDEHPLSVGRLEV